MHEYYLDWAWAPLVIQLCVDAITLIACFQFCTRELQTIGGFPFVRNLYLHLCCWYFYHDLRIQEAHRICQCVFPHQNSLEHSKTSQSVDVGLFSAQIKYLLLFNYSHSFICSFYLSGMPITFIMGSLEPCFNFFLYFRIFITLYFCPWSSEFGLRSASLFLQISY